MKKLFLLFACMTALAVLLNVPSASAQGKLEGVWQVTEVTTTGPNGGTSTNPPPHFMIFTKKYFSRIGTWTPQPDLPQNATDAQKLATWTPLNAALGTYDIKGSTLTLHHIVRKNGVKPGFFVTNDFKIEGNTLTVIQKADQSGPAANPITLKLVRVE